eukprot:768607-Hanusia_phi.AAC.11
MSTGRSRKEERGKMRGGAENIQNRRKRQEVYLERSTSHLEETRTPVACSWQAVMAGNSGRRRDDTAPAADAAGEEEKEEVQEEQEERRGAERSPSAVLCASCSSPCPRSRPWAFPSPARCTAAVAGGSCLDGSLRIKVRQQEE